MAEKWMAEAFKGAHGQLRTSLHAKKGRSIPRKRLEEAAHSRNPTLRKRAVLARTARRYAGR